MRICFGLTNQRSRPILNAEFQNMREIMRWMTEHVASIMNRHLCNAEGQTPYEALHGQRFKGKGVEFGERVFYFVPKKLRSKLNLRWRVGTFLGNAQTTNEAFVGMANGDVVKSRSAVRVVEPSRWNQEAVLGVRGVPSIQDW